MILWGNCRYTDKQLSCIESFNSDMIADLGSIVISGCIFFLEGNSVYIGDYIDGRIENKRLLFSVNYFRGTIKSVMMQIYWNEFGHLCAGFSVRMSNASVSVVVFNSRLEPIRSDYIFPVARKEQVACG